MTPEAFEKACLALPGASVSIKWGSDRVYTVAEKMFAVLGMNDPPPAASFKVSDTAFALLVERPGVRPAPYLARARWVQIESLDGVMDDEELTARLAEAHRLVAAKLPKRLQPKP